MALTPSSKPWDKSLAIIEFDSTGKILNANGNFCAAIGYSLGEIQGRHHSMFVEPAYADSSEYRAFWAKLARGEYIADEFMRVGKGGKEVWIQASYNPIFDVSNRVVRVVKFATDIADRVRAVNELAQGLSQLASNDLEVRLDRPMGPAFEVLRQDFNRSLDSVSRAMGQVAERALAMQTGTVEISDATNDLSKRTEQQAASLEETAAALDQITATVKRSADGTRQASVAASDAKADAERSGMVVAEAVLAMGEIAESSNKISQIIGVIDEIAFQTNLLTLNAGVEAARAGDADRGFAVVAQEVRALAQRSAEAAKEIKALIASSSDQVRQGVQLVGNTGDALGLIVAKVTEIDTLISEISQSAQEQATGISQVNTAVNQMDQVTQQNAAMVEQASAATINLKTEAEHMAGLMQQFRLGGVLRHHGRKPLRPAPTAPPPTRLAAPRPASPPPSRPGVPGPSTRNGRSFDHGRLFGQRGRRTDRRRGSRPAICRRHHAGARDPGLERLDATPRSAG